MDTNRRCLYLLILALSIPGRAVIAASPAESQLTLLLQKTSGAPAKRVEELKGFIKSNPGSTAASDAQLLAGLAILKTEEAGAEKEAYGFFKEVMKQRRGTWREAVATVSMVNALHVSGEHESVRELATYSLKNGTLDTLDSAQSSMTDDVKAENDVSVQQIDKSSGNSAR